MYALAEVAITAYVFVFVACVAVAAYLPKSWKVKVLAVLAVLAFFGYPHMLSHISTRKYMMKRDATEKMLADSCASDYVAPVQRKISDLYLEKSTITSMYSLDDHFKYMAKHHLTLLEIDSDVLGGSSLYDFRPLKPTEHKYLALFVAKRDSEYCQTFYRWGNKYPAQRFPALRYFGFGPDSCIGIRGADTIKSNYRLSATSRSLLWNDEPTGLAQYEYSMEDRAGSVVAKARASRIIESSSWKLACVPGDRRFGEFSLDAIVSSYENRMPEVITNDFPQDFQERRKANAADIEALRGMDNVNQVFSTNLIDDSATVWFEHKYTKNTKGSVSLAGYYLVVYSERTIYRTFIRVGSIDPQLITGLSVTPAGIQIVAVDYGGNRWALTYSLNGVPQRSLELDEIQFKAISAVP